MLYRPMAGQAKKISFEFSVFVRVNSHGYMPAPIHPTPVADAVTVELNRFPPHVSNLLFLVSEKVCPFCCDEYERPVISQIVKVRLAEPLSSCPGPLGHVDAVSLDQLAVYRTGILSQRNRPAHVEPVAMLNISNGQLLNESPF
jgi:hypothetical protein